MQDQWTRNRLTLQGALRYEKAWSFFPEGLNGLQGDSRFGGPKRTLESAEGVTGYHDIAPRMGLAYDVFGNGKTAIKANLSKYWQYAANDGVYIGTNPAATFAQTANRSWNDANRDFVPQCDLNVAAGRRRVRRPEQPELLRVPGQRIGAQHGHRRQPRPAERLERAAL